MNNFCTKCGAELNGKSKCEKCGNVNGGALQNIADKVKNYDYKSKADELKAKANEAVDKAKAYDYKGKAEEIKEAAKNYDYTEKAKEISESVKNYDYKAETENIKKGGIKYFWNKHRKLSIAIIIVLVCFLGFNIFKSDSDWALRNMKSLDGNLSDVIKAENKLSDSGEPQNITDKSVMYYNVDFLNYTADLGYVVNNSGNRLAIVYTIKNISEEDIVKAISKKLGKPQTTADIVPNYIWNDDNYKYNLIYVKKEATFVISNKNAD